MDEIQAKKLIKKMLQAAYMAGKHGVNTNSLLAISNEKKAIDLGDEIVRHLTSSSSRAAGAEASWAETALSGIVTQMKADRKKPPPA